MVDVIALIDNITKEDNNIVFIEQYVQEVVDFSSQYGSDISISYTAYNLAGKPSKYPDYGDYPQAFVMRTYGRWWKEAPSRTRELMPQNLGSIVSQDYIDVTFEEAVYPFQVNVYEIYNPGALVRVWAGDQNGKWALLWEGAAQGTRPIPRIFSPPLRTIHFPTKLLRLEFDHTGLEYYTELDAVLLVGTKRPFPDASDNCFHTDETSLTSQASIRRRRNRFTANGGGAVLNLGDITTRVQELNIQNLPPQVDISSSISTFLDHEFPNLLKEIEEMQNANTSPSLPMQHSQPSSRGANSGAFSCLPDETILHIMSYLDLQCLCRCSQVNKHFRGLATDSLLYTELGLRTYWNCFSAKALESLASRCSHLQKLDLSWCGSYGQITPSHFIQFLDKCGHQLTHLRLNCCKFVTDDSIQKIASTCVKLKELSLENCQGIDAVGFSALSSLHDLERLDLYRTLIGTEQLQDILKATPRLKHLNLGSLMHVSSMDEVILTVTEHNLELVSVDLWKSYTLTSVGVRALGNCFKLEEIDLGWCLSLGLPGTSLASVAHGCPRLKKLFIASLRSVLDNHLEPFIRNCPNLEQVDLLGCSVTSEIVSRLLRECTHLKLLDVSFCDQISEAQVDLWRRQYPGIQVKRSYQAEVRHSSPPNY